MRPLPRILLNAATLLSAVLCVATLVWWGRSYFHREVRIGAADGRLMLVGVESSQQYADDLCGGGQNSRDAFLSMIDNATTAHGLLGLRYAAGQVQGSSARGWAWGGRYGVNYKVIAIPFAYPFVLLAILPVTYLYYRRRTLCRLKSGRCLSCGYDLRGTPVRCPECGAVPKVVA
jgi:hypothetical protein